MKKLSYEQILKSKATVEEVKNKKRNPIFVVLDNIRSMHNVGAIFRTCDAVLVEKIFLCGITATPPRKEIAKTALGAEELVPWEYFDETVEALRFLKKNKVKIVAVELAEGSVPYDRFESNQPIAFVFGHEVNGISDEVMDLVDAAVEVPMLGRANSLNIATCCGIILYESLKKLRK